MSGIGDMEDVLAWYVAVGADEAIGEVAADRLTRPAPVAASAVPSPPKSAAVTPAEAMPAAPVPQALRPISIQGELPRALAAAREQAAAAGDLEALRRAVTAFEGCALKLTATNTVFSDGNPESPLMFIGEAPGADEDRIGRPFVGVSGQLLDRMLATIGIDRTSAYITNVLFWRPPGNRKPTPAEIESCRPFVERHIALVRPKLLVLVGGTASSALVPGSAGIMRLRGRWFPLTVAGLDQPVQTIAMYHPSFLLRSPDRKRDSWADLLSIKSKLKETAQ